MKTPSLPRPLGRRFGEDVASVAASSLVHAGDVLALDSLLSEHQAELTAEAAQIRAQSKTKDDGFESKKQLKFGLSRKLKKMVLNQRSSSNSCSVENEKNAGFESKKQLKFRLSCNLKIMVLNQRSSSNSGSVENSR